MGNGKYKVIRAVGKHFKRVTDEEGIYVSDKHETIITEQELSKVLGVIKYRRCQKGKRTF